MRKNGWQLPYHPLQVVAVAVFLALGFAFYVFFAPFLGKKIFQYIAIGIYTPLIICVFGLYVWCAAADPADSGVFRSKKYLKVPDNKKHCKPNLHGGSNSSIQGANAAPIGEEIRDKTPHKSHAPADCKNVHENKNGWFKQKLCFLAMLPFLPCTYVCDSHEESSDQQMSEDGMFYCSLCEVEVFKYSKHCRVCDKCVDRFDHHCRWLNNCIGKRNYRKFFTLMVSGLLLFILQWSTGILVLVCCFLEKNRFSKDISSKLGSSFSIVPFVIVVAVCTILAMIATLPLAQLFFFHILLIKKGISTYDYIIALREQEQQGTGEQQSPQMSPASSITGLSSASSFNTFHRAAWCTPPRLFLEDQFDVVPTDVVSVSSVGKKMAESSVKRKAPTAVKISPWALARLNSEDVSKAAAEARRKSKILRPVVRYETDSSIDSSSRMAQRSDYNINNNRKKGSKHIRLPSDIPIRLPAEAPDAKSKRNVHMMTLTSLTPHKHEAFMAMPGSTSMVASSPESSLDSPDNHPFQCRSVATEEARISGCGTNQNEPLSRSTSGGGYDASGGEDSDRMPTRMLLDVSGKWGNLFGSEQEKSVKQFMPQSSLSIHRKL